MAGVLRWIDGWSGPKPPTFTLALLNLISDETNLQSTPIHDVVLLMNKNGSSLQMTILKGESKADPSQPDHEPHKANLRSLEFAAV